MQFFSCKLQTFPNLACFCCFSLDSLYFEKFHGQSCILLLRNLSETR